MREIKFRFLMEDGTVTTEYYLIELIDSDAYINIECEWNSKIKQELQYTGLKDKNGDEIYEGDIIQGKVIQSTNSHPMKVQFSKKGCWQVEFKDFGYSCYDSLFEILKDDDYEGYYIIGNIYENPELLEVEL